MPTLEQVSKELLNAMKSKDEVRVSTLRMLVSAVRYKEIEKKKPLAEAEFLEVIQAEAKRRKESMEEYSKANRADLAAKEEAEYTILKAYLPEPMSAAELESIVTSAIAAVSAKGPQDMGKVMSQVMPQIKGRADGKQAQGVVSRLLGAKS